MVGGSSRMNKEISCCRHEHMWKSPMWSNMFQIPPFPLGCRSKLGYTYHQMLAHLYLIIIQLRLLVGQHDNFLQNKHGKHPWLPGYHHLEVSTPVIIQVMDDHFTIKITMYSWDPPIFRTPTPFFSHKFIAIERLMLDQNSAISSHWSFQSSSSLSESESWRKDMEEWWLENFTAENRINFG